MFKHRFDFDANSNSPRSLSISGSGIFNILKNSGDLDDFDDYVEIHTMTNISDTSDTINISKDEHVSKVRICNEHLEDSGNSDKTQFMIYVPENMHFDFDLKSKSILICEVKYSKLNIISADETVFHFKQGFGKTNIQAFDLSIGKIDNIDHRLQCFASGSANVKVSGKFIHIRARTMEEAKIETFGTCLGFYEARSYNTSFISHEGQVLGEAKRRSRDVSNISIKRCI